MKYLAAAPAIAGAILVALSGGELNGGFVIGAPLMLGAVWVLMKDEKSGRSESEEN